MADVETVKKACDDCLNWLESNQMAEKEEFEHKREELQGICNPIFSKMYGGGAGGMPVACLEACPEACLEVVLLPAVELVAQTLKRWTKRFTARLGVQVVETNKKVLVIVL